MILNHPGALLLAVPAGFAFQRWARARGMRSLVRLSLLGTLVVIAAGPAIQALDVGTTLVLVIDRSRSMPLRAERSAARLVKRAEVDRGPADQLAVVDFGAAPVVARLAASGEPLEPGPRHVDPDQTNLYAAVAAALDLVPSGRRGRLLIVSDGLTQDRLSDALAARLRSGGVPIDFHHLARRSEGDVVLQSVRGPTEVEPGAEIGFQFQIAAAKATRGTLRVGRDGMLRSAQSIRIRAGRTSGSWRERGARPGLVRYRFELDVPGDPRPENNCWDALVTVRPRRAVLLLNATGGQTPLVEALGWAGLAIQVERATPVSVSLERLNPFRACVLEDVPAEAIGLPGVAALARFVEQLGGGLVISGGSHSFAAGGYRFSPLDPLLPVTLDGGTEAARPPLAMAVVMDLRGEPSWAEARTTPWSAPRQAALARLVNELRPADRMALVTMNDDTPAGLPLTGAAKRNDLEAALNGLGKHGGAPLLPGAIPIAVKLLNRAPQAPKHLLVCGEGRQLAELAGWGTDPFQAKPLSAASVTIVALGAPPELQTALRRFAGRPGRRVLFADGPQQLGPLLVQDLALTTGSGLVNRPITPSRVGAAGRPGLNPARKGSGAGSAPALPGLAGYHPATVREGATVAIAAQHDPALPLAAQGQRGLGRVGVLLFPIPPAQAASAGWQGLAKLLAEQVGWAARLDGPEPSFTAAVERSGRTGIVTLTAKDPANPGLLAAAPPDLSIVTADGSTPSMVEPFDRVGPVLRARFTLDRAESYTPVVHRDTVLLARCRPVTLPRSPEFLDPPAAVDGRAVLTDLAGRTGGREWTEDAPLYDEPIHVFRSLVPPFAWLALVLVLIDVADRRQQLTELLDRGWHHVRTRRGGASPTELTSEPADDLFERAKERSRRRLRR